MDIQITGEHLEITAALHDYIHKKADKLVHHFPTMIAMSVVLMVERELQIAESKISVPHFEAFAKADSTDMYHSIDQMMHKLETQLQKHKEKNEGHQD